MASNNNFEQLSTTRLLVGLGWDQDKDPMSDGYDLDTSIFMLDSNNKLPKDEYFVFYNNEISPDDAVVLTGDDRFGDSSNSSDNEAILIDFPKIHPEVMELDILVSIYKAGKRKQNFGQIQNSFVRMIDDINNEEIYRFDLEGDFSNDKTLLIGRFVRTKEHWAFEVVCRGYIRELDFFVSKYQR